MFLKISQNYQENTCAKVFLWFLRNFEDYLFYRAPPIAPLTGISCTCSLILFFTRFKLTLKVRTKPITVYSKIPLSKNAYNVETRTDLYMIQVFTERYFRTGSRNQWLFRCSKSTAFKINNKNTSATSLLLTFNISTILPYCFYCWLWAGKYPLGIRPQFFPKLAINLVEQPQWYGSGTFRVHSKTT